MAGIDDLSRQIGRLEAGQEAVLREGRRREQMITAMARQVQDRMSELASKQAIFQNEMKRESDAKHQANIECFEHVEGRLDTIEEERRVSRAVRDHRWLAAKIAAGLLAAMAAAATVWEVIGPWFRSQP